MIVDNLNHPLALTIRALLIREERKALQQMIIDDEENILQAIKSNIKINNIITTDRDKLAKEFLQLLPPSVPIIDLAKRTAKKIFGNEKVTRIFALADMPKPLPLKTLTAIPKDFIVLDQLSISGNIGAIVRTAVALEVGALILLDQESVDTYDRRVIRASRGYVFSLPIVNITTANFIQFCHDHHIKMLVTSPHAKTSINEAVQLKERLAIIFGSEKEGCAKILFDAAEIKAIIPIAPTVESLNVSAAASIILYLRNLVIHGYRIEEPLPKK